MVHATITITLPETVWIQQISTQYPDSTFEVLAAVPGSRSGFALVRIVGDDAEAVVDSMSDHEQITELTPARWGDGEVTVHFETTKPLLLFSSRESGMPFELPVEIQDGVASVEVTGTRPRLADLADRLENFGLQYRFDRIQERPHERQLLSERQLEVISAAVEEGYYDTPRRCSLTELAERLDIAKSTCSETLHRAEEAIIKQFLADRPRTPDSLAVEVATN